MTQTILSKGHTYAYKESGDSPRLWVREEQPATGTNCQGAVPSQARRFNSGSLHPRSFSVEEAHCSQPFQKHQVFGLDQLALPLATAHP